MESNKFALWLTSVKEQFRWLTDEEKTKTLEELLKLCGTEQLLFLTQTYLPLSCRIDFISLLPDEISDKIICYLDAASAFRSCLVSKSWNHHVNSCKILWAELVWSTGGVRQRLLSKQASIYKNQFIRRIQFLKTSQQGRYITTEYNRDSLESSVFCYNRNGHFGVAEKGSMKVLVSTIMPLRNLGHIQLMCAVRAVHMDRHYLYIASDSVAVSYGLESLLRYQTYQGHVRCLLSVHGCSEAGLVLTGSADCTIKLWNLHTSEILFSSHDHHIGWVCHVQFLTDLNSSTKSFLAYDSNANLSVWTVKGIENLNSWKVQHVDDLVTDMKKIPVSFPEKRGFFIFQKPLDFYHNTSCMITHYNVVLQDSDSNKSKLQLVRNIDIPVRQRLQDVVAIGERFIIYIQCVFEKYSICIYDLYKTEILMTVSMPEYLSGHNWIVIFDRHDWIDGFTSSNLPNSLFTVIDPHFVHEHQCKASCPSPTVRTSSLF